MKTVRMISRRKRQLKLIVVLWMQKMFLRVRKQFSAKYVGVMTRHQRIHSLTPANAMDQYDSFTTSVLNSG